MTSSGWTGYGSLPEPPGLSDNALLAHIRRLTLTFMTTGELDPDETAMLVRCVDLLDEHLTAGGAAPLEWRPAWTRETVDLPPL